MICALRVLVEGTGSRGEYIFEGLKKIETLLNVQAPLVLTF
jgi:hypothetical protein